MQEIWKDIVGYVGLYQVSNCGRVKSLDRVIFRKNGYIQTIKERILKPYISKNGYKVVALSINGKHKTMYVHRLVAESFIISTIYNLDVNHKDGNKLNNHVDNLEWLSRSNNMKHAHNIGLIKVTDDWKNKIGKANKGKKLSSEHKMKLSNLAKLQNQPRDKSGKFMNKKEKLCS